MKLFFLPQETKTRPASETSCLPPAFVMLKIENARKAAYLFYLKAESERGGGGVKQDTHDVTHTCVESSFRHLASQNQPRVVPESTGRQSRCDFFGVVCLLTVVFFSRGLMVSVSSISNDRSRQKWYRRRPFLVKAVFTDLQNGSYAAAVYSIVSQCLLLFPIRECDCII